MLMSMSYRNMFHTCVGFGVARFDNLGNARASERGTSNKDSHAFLYVSAIQ